MASKQSKAALAAAKAKADAKAAEANARVAEANAKAKEAEASARRIEAETARANEAAARAPYERGYQLAINAGAPVLGMAIGHRVAKSIDKRNLLAQAAKNRQIKVLAERLTNTRGKANVAKMAAVAATADKLGLLKRGPLGVPLAGVMLAEGAFARFVLAPTVPNETAREAIRAVGTTSLFAATTMIGNRMIQNATLAKLPPAAGVAAIETARALSAPASNAASGGASALRSIGGKALSVAGKVALPLTAAMTAYAAYQGYKSGGLKGALVGAGDSLTFGSVSALAKASGNGKALMSAGAKRAAGRAAIARSAATRAAVSRGVLASASRRPALRSDGMTKGYTATRNIGGKTVTVQVGGYKTPSRQR